MGRLSLLAAGILLLSSVALAVAPPSRSPLDRFFARFDANKDGSITRPECPPMMRRAFARMDANDDGKLSRSELQLFEDRLARFLGGQFGKGGRPGEINTPPAKGERIADRLKLGDVAPDFSLPLVKGEGEVRLSAFRGKRPVVLIFASYT